MNNIEIYKNYGCSAAEKRNVYTYGGQHETAICSDKMLAEIPEGWELAENEMGEQFVIAPWGRGYGIDEVLAGNDAPYFIVMHNDKTYREKLKIIK